MLTSIRFKPAPMAVFPRIIRAYACEPQEKSSRWEAQKPRRDKHCLQAATLLPYARRIAMDTITEVLTQAELRRRARVRDLQAALRIADASQTLGMRHLFRFTIGEYLLRQTHGSSATIQDRQQSAVVEVPILDEPVPFWQVSARLALERKRVLREALDSTATSLIQGFLPLYR